MDNESIRGVLRANLLEARPVPINKASIKRLSGDLYDELYTRHFRKFYEKNKNRPLSILFAQPRHSKHKIEFTELTGPLKGRKQHLPIVFWCGGTSSLYRSYVLAGGVSRSGYIGRQGYKNEVRLQLADRSILDYVRDKKVVVDELYSVLIHETTHLADKLERLAPLTDRESAVSYYNIPSEVRAFIQQVVDETVKAAKTIAKSLEGFTDTQQLVDRSLEYSKTWQRIRPYVNDENKKKILKAVYSVIGRADFPSRYSDE